MYILLHSGNVDPGNISFVWVIDTAPPTACRAVSRLPCSQGGVTSSKLCTIDVHGDDVASALYQVNKSGAWKTTNGTVVEVLVNSDGVQTVHLKVYPVLSTTQTMSHMYVCLLSGCGPSGECVPPSVRLHVLDGGYHRARVVSYYPSQQHSDSE